MPRNREAVAAQDVMFGDVQQKEATASEMPDVGIGFLVTYTVAFFGLFLALLTPVLASLALRIAVVDPANKGASLGIVLGIGALAATIANPLFGQFSDRTRSRIGRRRPWMLAGVLIGSLALAWICVASTIWAIAVAWCIAQIALNAALAALVAVVPDQVPERQRGRVSGLTGLATQMAILAGIGVINLVGTEGIAMFAVPTVMGLTALMWFILTIRDKPPLVREASPPWRLRDLTHTFWVNPLKYPDFGWAWLSRFLVGLAFAFLQSYQIYYLIDRLGIAADQVPGKLFLSQMAGFVCSSAAALVLGSLSDRLGRRKIFVLASALVYAAGIGLILVIPGFSGFLIGVATASLGLGAYFAIDQALVVDVLPNRQTDAAKNMGVLNIAIAVPQSLAPALAPFLLVVASADRQNYTLLFVTAVVLALAGAFSIMPVRGVR